MRWCPSSIVPSGRVFRQPSCPGNSDSSKASVERRLQLSQFHVVKGTIWVKRFEGWVSRKVRHFDSQQLLHYPPGRVKPQHRSREQQRVDAVEHPAVPRQNRPRVFHPGATLDQRLDQVS